MPVIGPGDVTATEGGAPPKKQEQSESKEMTATKWPSTGQLATGAILGRMSIVDHHMDDVAARERKYLRKKIVIAVLVILFAMMGQVSPTFTPLPFGK